MYKEEMAMDGYTALTGARGCGDKDTKATIGSRYTGNEKEGDILWRTGGAACEKGDIK